MSYIGNTPTTQNFIAGTDQFTGTGSQTNFTLSRFVNSSNDIEVVIANVVQNPTSYSISGNTLTISPAVGSGVAFYVRYLSTTLQSVNVPQGATVQFGGGSASGPSITFSNDTNTGIYSPAADTIAFAEGGVEVMRLDSSGNLGIGTSSPNRALTIYRASSPILQLADATSGTTANDGLLIQQSGVDAYIENAEIGFMQFRTSAVERMRIDANGQMRTTNGAGVVALAYDCRAWVNFNGTGTVAIRASGNVSSITDNGAGTYTVNFTTAMPDANSCVQVTVDSSLIGSTTNVAAANTSVASASRIDSSGLTDSPVVSVAIFR